MASPNATSTPTDAPSTGDGAVQPADLDANHVEALRQRLDVDALHETLSGLDDQALRQVQRAIKKAAAPKSEATLPAVKGDFYHLFDQLTGEQKELQMRVRRFMEEEVEPVINEYWQRDETPLALFKRGFTEHGLVDAVYNADGTRKADAAIAEGIISMEMSRIDVSTATFFGVHAGLAMGSVLVGGSEEQKAEWLPKMVTMEQIGCFGLTEPHVGSAASGGLMTTARREGDEWVLNGQKKWIGNAPFADMIVVWARDEADNQVKGFIVRCKENPGYQAEKIMGKIALRCVENGLVTLTDCRVSESDRLQNANSFKDTAEVLRMTRAGVAWQGIGCAMGGYEKALAYSQSREQFGKPIGNFQLIQKHLVDMLGNVVALQAMGLRLSQLQDAGEMTDAQASLAKVFSAARCRDTIGLARELFGGNGILLEHHVARYFCDTEAIYSYEGTNEINTLIVGRAVTGFGAFV
jgi:glutaryl-CoA dehydrogenase